MSESGGVMKDLSIFNPYIEKGLIKRQVSPCGRLVLFDYTEKCQYERAWDNVTLNTRGTVYELSTGKIVARPFPKFFNWSELDEEEQDTLLNLSYFTTWEKLDGSLGIIYFYDGEWRVNTRGSFTSDQAIKGKELLKPYEKDLYANQTYLCEIIYPENRVVVNYGKEEKLVFLTSYNTKYGLEDHDSGIGVFDHIATTHEFSNLEELQSHLKTLTYNEEGYVVRFSDGTRVKFKGDEYVKMHRIVTGISPLALWESMNNGKVSKELLMSIPEEFRDTYESMSKELEKKYKMVKDEVEDNFKNILVICGTDRKEIGLFLSKNDIPYSNMIFPRLLEKYDKLEQMIMREIRPKGNIL